MYTFVLTPRPFLTHFCLIQFDTTTHSYLTSLTGGFCGRRTLAGDSRVEGKSERGRAKVSSISNTKSEAPPTLSYSHSLLLRTLCLSLQLLTDQHTERRQAQTQTLDSRDDQNLADSNSRRMECQKQEGREKINTNARIAPQKQGRCGEGS